MSSNDRKRSLSVLDRANAEIEAFARNNATLPDKKKDGGDDAGDRDRDGIAVASSSDRDGNLSKRGRVGGDGPYDLDEAIPFTLPGPLDGCRSVDEFEKLNHIDEGTYGIVYRARDKRTGKVVALKKIKMAKEKDGFPLTSLREINILLALDHPNILNVSEVVVGKNLDSIFMVMEFMEHDLKGLLEDMCQPFSTGEVKSLMLQLLRGLAYLHENWVFHRDLKTSNILYNNKGEVKICDFGLARTYGSPLRGYTQLVVTLWYRAPELLLGEEVYSPAIDVWSMGCIMAELLTRKPLFDGKGEMEQVNKIFALLGTPSDAIWPGYSSLRVAKQVTFKHQPYSFLRKKFPPVAFAGEPCLSEKGFNLLDRMLTYDPSKRISASEALRHPWFDEVPRATDTCLMPTYRTHKSSGVGPRRTHTAKSPDPLEELRRREQLAEHEQAGGGLFRFQN